MGRMETIVTPISSAPIYTKGEFKVPDNWWHSKEYYNVPLDDYYQAILQAIKNGYSLVLSVDFTEPGSIPELDS